MSVRVPAFRPLQPKHVGECFNRDGAYALADRIREVWKAVGWAVRVWVEPMGKSDTGKPQYAIRSDLVNGLPRASSVALELSVLRRKVKEMEG